MATLTLNPTDVKVFYGVPSGVADRQFGIDITTGDLYFTADGTGVWTLLSTGGGNLTVGATAIGSGADGSVLLQDGGVLAEDANLTWDATNGLTVAKPVAVTGAISASTDGVFGGTVFISKNVAPADGDLAAGQLALWFDDTNGAGVLNIKAKTADGTVVTGTVTLT